MLCPACNVILYERVALLNFSADMHLEILLDFIGKMCYTMGKNSMIAYNITCGIWVTLRLFRGIYWPCAVNCYGQ